MYEKLVKRLRKAAGPAIDFPDTLYDEAADAIEELSKLAEVNAKRAMKWAADAEKAEETLRWIPVTERLPGREWVLCKCRANIYEVLSLRDGYWYHDPQYQYMSGFVTHWMPLPEPPKEEE